MIRFLDLASQYRAIKPDIDAAIADTIANSAFIGGAALKVFEAEFAAFQHADHCIGVGNGTDSLEIILEALDLPAGSEVIVDVAAKFAGALPYLTLAAEVIRGHHERWDGQGYPDMLGGTDIPLAARVAAVVTVYDALRSRRPYRPSVTHPRAVRMIGEECAGQFDPVLVTAFKLAAPQFDQVFSQHAR